jgi:high-affinity iron transporter
MTNTFIQAALILLREGLEAMLVIAALGAYLAKSGGDTRLRALYGGALGAIGASIVTAWIFATFNSGAHNDVVEAVVLVIAAVLMLYVSGWLMVRQDPRAWQGYLAQKANAALSQQSGWAIASLAFLAVFREGAETVLFIQALATTDGGWTPAMFGGLAAAAIVLVIAYQFINLIARRLPLRPVFVITSAFLFFMGIKFIGAAVQEFQEQGMISITDSVTGPVLVALGLNGTYEGIGLQLAVIVAALTTYILFQRRAARGRAELPTPLHRGRLPVA